jgi:hypothetical protein
MMGQAGSLMLLGYGFTVFIYSLNPGGLLAQSFSRRMDLALR